MNEISFGTEIIVFVLVNSDMKFTEVKLKVQHMKINQLDRKSASDSVQFPFKIFYLKSYSDTKWNWCGDNHKLTFWNSQSHPDCLFLPSFPQINFQAVPKATHSLSHKHMCTSTHTPFSSQAPWTQYTSILYIPFTSDPHKMDVNVPDGMELDVYSITLTLYCMCTTWSGLTFLLHEVTDTREIPSGP